MPVDPECVAEPTEEDFWDRLGWILTIFVDFPEGYLGEIVLVDSSQSYFNIERLPGSLDFNAELSLKKYWREPRSQEVGKEGDCT